MARNTYYRSSHWQALRRQALARDRYTCTVPGCGAKGTHVDHIKTRPNSDGPTQADVLSNTRTLCASHDAQIKERANGDRGRGGKLVVRGCDADGWPADPMHPWAKD